MSEDSWRWLEGSWNGTRAEDVFKGFCRDEAVDSTAVCTLPRALLRGHLETLGLLVA